MSESQSKTDFLPDEKSLGYCAILLSENAALSKRSNNYEDFLPLMEQTLIAWIDVKVEDFQEATPLATQLGF